MDGFWAEALLTAVYIINMSPSRPLGSQIPQELWIGRKPDYGKLCYMKFFRDILLRSNIES
jgi:hypothetical protein